MAIRGPPWRLALLQCEHVVGQAVALLMPSNMDNPLWDQIACLSSHAVDCVWPECAWR